MYKCLVTVSFSKNAITKRLFLAEYSLSYSPEPCPFHSFVPSDILSWMKESDPKDSMYVKGGGVQLDVEGQWERPFKI